MKEVLKTLGKDHRIEILNLIREKPIRIYDTYKVLKKDNPTIYISMVERALKELWKIGLIYRDEQKRFYITAYGTYLLRSILDFPDQEVIAYLKKKRIDLPEEFLKEIPYIFKNSIIMKEVEVLEKFFKVQQEIAREALIILDKPIFSQEVMKNNIDMLKRGVKFRCILQKNNFKTYFDEDLMKRMIDLEILREHNQAILLNQSKYDVQTRYLFDIKMDLYIADRRIIFINFPDMDDNISINEAVVSYKPEIIKWGLRVFDYFWQRAEKEYMVE